MPARPTPFIRISTLSRATRPDHIVILAGDHIYKMDYEPMLQMHDEREADVTVGCIEVPREEASGFGVMAVDGNDQIKSFLEKPKDPPAMPDKPDKALCSMGIYVFATKFLFDQLRRDAADPDSSRDFGKDIIPYLVKHGKALAHRFHRSCVRSGFEAEAYWRDVGTLDAYWQANIDLDRGDSGARPVRQRMADMDLWRGHAAGKIRA